MPSKVLSLTCLLLSSSAVMAQEAAQQWLERMSQALHQQNYQASLVYLQDQHLSSMKLQHAMEQGKERERLVYNDGAPRELLREGETLVQVGPEGRGPFSGRFGVSSPLLGQLNQDWQLLERSYRIKLLDMDRIANRPVRKLEIQPRDNLRYGYQLWIDEQSALPMHSRIVDMQGKILEQFMVVDLEWPWQPATDFWSVAMPQTLEPVATAPVSANWILGWLPEGFMLERVSHKTGKHGMVEHQLYGDGLASLSVYLDAKDRPLSGVNSRTRIMKMGATLVLDQLRNNLQLTLIGELPASTLERIAAGVVAAEQSPKPVSLP